MGRTRHNNNRKGLDGAKTFADMVVNSVKIAMEGFAPADSGKRIQMKSPDTFNGKFEKFRRWWESVKEYLHVNQSRAPTDDIKIIFVGSLMKERGQDWYQERKRDLEAKKLHDNWAAFSASLVEDFTVTAQRQGPPPPRW